MVVGDSVDVDVVGDVEVDVVVVDVEVITVVVDVDVDVAVVVEVVVVVTGAILQWKKLAKFNALDARNVEVDTTPLSAFAIASWFALPRATATDKVADTELGTASTPIAQSEIGVQLPMTLFEVTLTR